MRESCEFGYYHCGEEWLEGGFDQERDESKPPSPGSVVISVPGRMEHDKENNVMLCHVRSFCCQKHLQEHLNSRACVKVMPEGTPLEFTK